MSNNTLPLAASCLHDTFKALLIPVRYEHLHSRNVLVLLRPFRLHAERQGPLNGCPCYAIAPFLLEHLYHWFVWFLAYVKMFTEGLFAGYLFLEFNVMDLPRPLPVNGHRAVLLLWTRSTQQRPL
jgi:hypothetical protein